MAFPQTTAITTIPTASFSGIVTKVIDSDTLNLENNGGKTMAIRPVLYSLLKELIIPPLRGGAKIGIF